MPSLYHFISGRSMEPLVFCGAGTGTSAGIRARTVSPHMATITGRICQYLKNFQIEGIRFLYRQLEKGESCILNDESGLGKCVMVSVFLGALLSTEEAVLANKKCLIVVQNDDCVVAGWQFHLGLLSNLSVQIINESSDIRDFYTVYIVKWSTLKGIGDVNKLNFDYVVIDNRGEMLSNNFCSGLLLKNYENRATIVISSVDVSANIRLLHIILRLCGRLERQYTNVRLFEEKFKLPNLKEVSNHKKLDLEEYFLKREKVINYCREFRLRRYRHQYEDILPLVSVEQYKINLQLWHTANVNSHKSDLSSGSVKELSSSSEKDTEELFKSYFRAKEEKQLNRKLLKQTNQTTNNNIDPNNGDFVEMFDEEVVMSPLLFVSETESENEKEEESVKDISESTDVASVFENVTQDVILKRKENPNISFPSCQVVKSKVVKKDSDSQMDAQIHRAKVKETATAIKSPYKRTAIQEDVGTRVLRRNRKSENPQKCDITNKRELRRTLRSKKTELSETNPKQIKTKRNSDKKQKETKIKTQTYQKTPNQQKDNRLPEKENGTALSNQERQLKSRMASSLPNVKKLPLQLSITKSEQEAKSLIQTVKISKARKLQSSKNISKARKMIIQRHRDQAFIKKGVHRKLTRAMRRMTRSAYRNSKYMVVDLSLDMDKTKPKSRRRKAAGSATVSTNQHKTKLIVTKSDNASSKPESMPFGQQLVFSTISSNDFTAGITENQFLPPITPPPTKTQENNLFLVMPYDSDVCFVKSLSQNSEVIVVSSSNEDDGTSSSMLGRRTRNKLKLSQRKAINMKSQTFSQMFSSKEKSPDLFSTCSDVSLTCSQKSKTQFEGFKIFGSEVKQFQQQYSNASSARLTPNPSNRSCLDILENMFEPHKQFSGASSAAVTPIIPALPIEAIKTSQAQEKMRKKAHPAHVDDDLIFEITNNATFGSMIRVNSNGDTSPIQQEFHQNHQTSKRNKITNYLIGSASLDEDNIPRTPKQQKAAAAESSSLHSPSRKSPKIKATQSNKLTNWLIKNGVSKSTAAASQRKSCSRLGVDGKTKW